MNYMRNRIQLLSKVAGQARRHPTVVVSMKASVAAGLAWLLAGPLGGLADHYRYYAPLGAVVATSTTAARSLRETVQALTSITLGAATALVALALPAPRVLALVLATGVGVAVGSCPLLGRRSSWVPITALFVLLVGDAHPWHYALGYASLTTAGAVVGIAVDAVLPQRRTARQPEETHPVGEEASPRSDR
ncbi:MAG TPA: hypothetical protein VNC22_09840 [Sporichthya sp.]|nr:hypothetical protein [Sporichthya sp.]